jgi:hypothetical protein
MRNAVSDVGRLNCPSFFNGTKEEAEGTATRCRPLPPPVVPAFGGFDTQYGIPGLVGGN